MWLFDEIVQRRVALCARDGLGQLRELPGPELLGDRIEDCALRYVLSDDVVELAMSTLLGATDAVAASMDLLRLPHPLLWVEWNENVKAKAIDGYIRFLESVDGRTRRVGLLIEADGDGSAGRAFVCWKIGEWLELSGVSVAFNFRHPIGFDPTTDSHLRRSITFTELTAFQPLLRHAVFVLQPEWLNYFRAALPPEKLEAAITQAMGLVAWEFPFLASLLMVQATPALAYRASNLERLNAARERRGKPNLLEHVEVCSTIDRRFVPQTTASGEKGGRNQARLHFVRGHFFRRGTKIHWRTGHIRGDPRKVAVESRTMLLRTAD